MWRRIIETSDTTYIHCHSAATAVKKDTEPCLNDEGNHFVKGWTWTLMFAFHKYEAVSIHFNLFIITQIIWNNEKSFDVNINQSKRFIYLSKKSPMFKNVSLNSVSLHLGYLLFIIRFILENEEEKNRFLCAPVLND